MQYPPELNREMLRTRHRLTHQQIDRWLGTSNQVEPLESKIGALNLVGEFLRITRLLSKAGIAYIPFKGPILSHRLYNDATCRYSKDFDLLFEAEDIQAALEVLLNSGYIPIIHEWPKDTRQERFFLNYRNQFQVENPENETIIELHWKLFSYPPIKKSEIEALIKNHQASYFLTDQKYTVLDNEMELVYLIIHGGLHSWRRLKWLADIHEIASQGLYDKSKFKELACRLKAQRMVALCNGMLTYYFPDQPLLPHLGTCPKFLVRHSFKMIQKETDNEFESLPEIFSYLYFVMIAFPGLIHKINMIRKGFDSIRSKGLEEISIGSLIISLLRPWQFFKKRYKHD